MSSYQRGTYLLAAAAAVSLVALATTTAQPPADDPFGAPLGTPAEEAAPAADPEQPSADKKAALYDAILDSAKRNTPVYWADEQSKQSTHIRRVLRDPLNSIGIEVKDAPLNEVVKFIRDEYNIEVQLDLVGLDEIGLNPKEPVTADLRHVSLGSALQLMLRPLELTYYIDNEVLVITTDEVACARPVVAIYPVGDLLEVKQGYERDATTDNGARRPEDIETLVDLIYSNVASDTWIVNGGPEAEIRTMQPGLLVVTQTQDVHERISKLLLALRLAKDHPAAVPHRGLTPEEREERNAEHNHRGGGAF